MHIVSLGELLVDMFPAELGRRHAEVSAFHPTPGGGPANVAVAAHRLGADVAFIGKVGDDPFGHWLVEVMAREGVATHGMRIDSMARTTMNVLAQPDANHYDCLFYRNPGADTLLRPDELDVDLLRSTRAFHFASLSLTDEPSRGAALEAAHIAREAGALVSFDANYRPTLWQNPNEAMACVASTIPLAHVLKVNEGELALLSGQELALDWPGWEARVAEASRWLLTKGSILIVVTLGPSGAFFQTNSGSGFVPGFNVRTVDATGCGDAFIAGLLWQLVRDRPDLDSFAGITRAASVELLPQILRYANAVGALTATRRGVIPILPTASEVEEFLRTQA